MCEIIFGTFADEILTFKDVVRLSFRMEKWRNKKGTNRKLCVLTEYRYKFGSYSVGFSLFGTNGWSSVASPETKIETCHYHEITTKSRTDKFHHIRYWYECVCEVESVGECKWNWNTETLHKREESLTPAFIFIRMFIDFQ